MSNSMARGGLEVFGGSLRWGSLLASQADVAHVSAPSCGADLSWRVSTERHHQLGISRIKRRHLPQIIHIAR
jgi:hypothetical protein